MSSPSDTSFDSGRGSLPPSQRIESVASGASANTNGYQSGSVAGLARTATNTSAGSGNASSHSRDSSHSNASASGRQPAQYQQRPQTSSHLFAGSSDSHSSSSNDRQGFSSSAGLGITQPLLSSASDRPPYGMNSTGPSISGSVGSEHRPPLRGSISDGVSGAPLPPPFFSGSTTNAAGQPGSQSPFQQPTLMHSSSNSSLNAAAASMMPPSQTGPSTYGLINPPGSTPGDPRTSLLVSNLPYKVRWQDLKDLFRRSAGTVLRADVSLTPDGRSRCFGSVLMRDPEDARRAKETFDGFEWMGKRLGVMYEVQSQPGYYPNSQQQQQQQQYPSQQQYQPQQQQQYQPQQQSQGFSSPLPQPASTAKSPALLPFLSSTGRADSASSNASSRSLPLPSRLGVPARSPGTPASEAAHHSNAYQQSGLPPLPHLAPPRPGSFSGASNGGDLRRPSAHDSQRSSVRSPQPPPPPALATHPPNAIPTQHQIAVLSAQAAQAAIAAQQARVVAEYGGAPDASYYGRTLFVGNLAYATQWQDLKDLFRAAGNIMRADIALGPEGRSRGFGTVLFGTKDEAARAVKIFHGYDYNGRTLKVHFDRFARMEAPPPGVLVPARAEDYTSAFSAAQPPSNVGAAAAGGQRAMSSGPTGGMMTNGMFMGQMPGMGPQGGYQQHGQGQQSQYALPPPYQQQQYQYQQQQQQQQFQQQQFQQPQPRQQQYQQYQRSPLPPPLPYFDGHQAAQTWAAPPAAATSTQSAAQLDEPFRNSGARAEETRRESQAPRDAEGKASSSQAGSSSLRPTQATSSASNHPGKISLPSPPSMSRQFNPYATNGSSNSPVQYRAPMPMTPGVPLTPGVPMTPGMPGFSFAGMLPPPTPPTFVPPFMNGGASSAAAAMQNMMAMTPGAGPPTPWQIPGMSAAPGAPLHLMGGQTTPRGVGGGFNPFFAGVVGYNATLPPTPGWHRGTGGRVQQQQPQRQASVNQSQVETVAENQQAESSTTSDKSASGPGSSPAAPAATDSGAGTPATDVQDTSARGEGQKEDAGSSTSAAGVSTKPTSHFNMSHSLSTRRASTNSPAVSPSLHGVPPGSSNTSFGYFGSVMGGDSLVEKERRPSLDAGALRTPMVEVPPRSPQEGDYFGAAAEVPTAASSSAIAEDEGSGDGKGQSPGPGLRPALEGGRQPSTEEMARAIAKMSIEGKALLKRGTSGGSSKAS